MHTWLAASYTVLSAEFLRYTLSMYYLEFLEIFSLLVLIIHTLMVIHWNLAVSPESYDFALCALLPESIEDLLSVSITF